MPHRPEQSVPGMPNHKRDDQSAQAQYGARGVHGAVARIAVLVQVEGEEFVVAGKLRLGHRWGLGLCRANFTRGRPIKRWLCGSGLLWARSDMHGYNSSREKEAAIRLIVPLHC